MSARSRGQIYVVPALLWTLLFFAVPFVLMVLMSLSERMEGTFVLTWNPAEYLDFVSKAPVRQALWNSLEITLTVTVLSILLAWPFAWVLAMQVPEPWQRLALLLAIVPFWTSYVVRSYAWLLVLAKNGILNKALLSLGVISMPLDIAASRVATVTGFVHFFVMLLTLTIWANLKQLSPNYARAAADLGAGPFRTLFHIILPLSLPGVMVGAFLTFVLCLGDYITPEILGGGNELVLPQLIMTQIERRADFPAASAMSLILMGVVTIAWLASARWLRLERG